MNKKCFKSYSIFWLILLLPSICFSQGIENSKWLTLESPKKDLLFNIPENFLINNENSKREIYASQNNVVMNVTIDDAGSPKNILKFYRTMPGNSDVKISQFKMDDFIGYFHKTEKDGKLFFAIYIASPKEFYSISTSTKDSLNPAFKKFIGSIKLGGRTLFEQQKKSSELDLPKFAIETLTTSAIILDVLRAKKIKKDKNSKKREIKYETEDDKKIEDEKDYSRPIIILQRPIRVIQTARDKPIKVE